MLLERKSSRWNVFAIDLKNEPNIGATWGDFGIKTDWNKAAERMINVRSVCLNFCAIFLKRVYSLQNLSSFQGLFFVDGLSWGNNLAPAEEFPINTS